MSDNHTNHATNHDITIAIGERIFSIGARQNDEGRWWPEIGEDGWSWESTDDITFTFAAGALAAGVCAVLEAVIEAVIEAVLETVADEANH